MMTSVKNDKLDRWRQMQELFHAALAMPTDQRDAYIAAHCRDATIRLEVDRLLKAHAQTDDFLRADSDDDDGRADEAVMLGRRIGPYQLVDHIAHGGMGAVYRAQRVDKAFEHQVAVKLVNPWMVTPLLRSRFVRERQTLANLDHPGITHLLDGGTTEDGIPYLVMDYVAGLPIDAYCAEHGLTTADRLTLFREVCEVVAHAHRNLVVHRDLKPSNILVTEDGRPKLLDFGIASLLAPTPDGSAVAITSQSVHAMTLLYASPEQIRGEPITTAADVYSLGVVLYELLSGRRPYQLTGRLTYEDERTVCETEPELPSDAVMRNTDGADDEAGNGGDQRLPEPPRRLRHRLRGDLDAIVMKSMHKQPDGRYESVSALSDDVARYLNGLPIRAQHHSAGYRAAKFVRRNRVAVSATLIVAISIIGGGVAASIGLVREARAHRVAREEAAEAAAVNRFLNEMLSSVDPRRDGREVRVAEVLERAAEDVGSRFDERPGIQAELRTTIGRCYRELGMVESAAEQLEAALELREAQHGPEHRKTLAAMNELAMVRVMQNELPVAEELLERALQSSRRQFGQRDELVLSTLSSLAGLRNAQGRLPEAERILRQLLEVQQEQLGQAHPGTIRTIHNLGLVLYRQEKIDEAEFFFRLALDLHNRVHGANHIHTIRARGNLAELLMERGALEEAEPLLLSALEGARRVLGDQHPETIQWVHNLAVLRHYQGRDEEALALARDALEAAEASLPPGHIEIARYLSHLGECLTALGRFAEAEQELLEAHASFHGQLGDGHPYTQTTVARLIELYEAWGRRAAAAEWRTRADER